MRAPARGRPRRGTRQRSRTSSVCYFAAGSPARTSGRSTRCSATNQEIEERDVPCHRCTLRSRSRGNFDARLGSRPYQVRRLVSVDPSADMPHGRHAACEHDGGGGHDIMDVGFIGLGHMGAGMAANLLRAGHRVTVYNRTPSRARPLVEQGARAATRVRDACGGDAVITMLADDASVEAVVFGDDGMIRALREGAIHISMSTISVALSERLATAHAHARQRFVAAPVFGRPEAAAAAKLFIVAGS